MKNLELSTDFEIIFRGDFLHVVHPDNFEISPEGNVKLWNALETACKTHNCYKVLSEGKINLRKMKAWNVFDSGSQASEINGLRLACLFYNYQPDEMSAFFKTVSANRGAKVEFFTDKTAALEWLGIKEIQ
jgi:hypothetical protein